MINSVGAAFVRRKRQGKADSNGARMTQIEPDTYR
jgi:hypothetical protein